MLGRSLPGHPPSQKHVKAGASSGPAILTQLAAMFIHYFDTMASEADACFFRCEKRIKICWHRSGGMPDQCRKTRPRRHGRCTLGGAISTRTVPHPVAWLHRH